MKSNHLIIFIGALFVAIASSNATSIDRPVRVLTWWDYISPKVLTKIEKAGVKVDLSFYKSNEVAFSKLVSKNNFDVAIISSIILGSVSSITNLRDIRAELNRPDYLKMLELKGMKCVPYLWSATVFAVIGDEKVHSLHELIELKKKNYSIAIIDEPFEIFARTYLDHHCISGDKDGFINWDHAQECSKNATEINGLASGDLKSSTAEYLTKTHSAAYAWHGELRALLDKKNKINTYLPQEHPIVGADYVCVLHKANSNKNTLKFVQLLTDRESTEYNVENNGYFSPYAKHTKGLHPDLLKIYTEVINLPKSRSPIMLTAAPGKVHNQINQIFQKIRYEKK